MILSGLKIKEELNKGLFISDFSEERLNPNSYNLRLHNELLIYKRENSLGVKKPLDMKTKNKTKKIIIPEDGLVIKPGKLYLGRTYEKTETNDFVPIVEGRSSIGRLGLFVHVTAGFGDIGFKGYWTLELMCIEPVRIYPFVEICQIFYHTIEGRFIRYSSGKYQNNNNIQSSKFYEEFKKGD